MSGRRPEFYFCDKSLRADQGHDWSSHEHDVLTLVVHGRLREEFDHDTHTCGRLELHYKPAASMHRTTTGPEGVRMLLVGLLPDRIRGFTPCSPAPRRLQGGVESARILASFLQLRNANLARRVRAKAVHRLLEQAVLPSDRPHHRGPAWVEDVAEIIRAPGGHRARLAEIAHRMGVHPVYLARAFRKRFGTSIGAFRRRELADRAVDRLAGTDAPLADLAYELGYADQSHFTREFNKQTGWSPGRFRVAVSELNRLGG